MIRAILAGTPIAVYLLFAWLVWNGLSRLHARRVPMTRVVIVPLLFIAWGSAGLAGRDVGVVGPCLLAIGLASGLAVGTRVQIEAGQRCVLRPASVLPLLRNVSIFLAHYALHVAAAIEPQRQATLMRTDAAVSALCAGFFIGWLIRFGRAWRRATQANRVLAPPVQALLHPPMR